MKHARTAAFLATGLLWAGSARAALNPAEVYCRALGYAFYTTDTPKGKVGICQMPDGRLVNAYKFHVGLVALEHSYCATKGYEARHVENDELCGSCTACLMPGGDLQLADLAMGLSFKEGRCGDGKCSTGENFTKCASDCPSGGSDDFCDGVDDGTCDEDCLDDNEPDPDCNTDGEPAKKESNDGCGCHSTRDVRGGLWVLLLALFGR